MKKITIRGRINLPAEHISAYNKVKQDGYRAGMKKFLVDLIATSSLDFSYSGLNMVLRDYNDISVAGAYLAQTLRIFLWRLWVSLLFSQELHFGFM